MNEEKVGPLFLIKQSLARLRAFRYVVAAAAAVTLASTVFIALEDLPKAVIGVVFLLMFAFLLIILESSRGTLEKSRPGRVLSLFVLWSIAVLFVGLTTAGGWYVVREILFPMNPARQCQQPNRRPCVCEGYTAGRAVTGKLS